MANMEVLSGVADMLATAAQKEGAQRRLAEASQRQLVSIIESSDDAIISKDLNGTIVSWNKGAERLFGYTAAEAIGKPVTMLIPDDHLDEEPQIIHRIRRGERIQHYETVRQRKDGSRVDISLSVSPVKDTEDRVIGAAKIARDISMQRAVEQKLQQLASIVEYSEDAIISKDLNGTIVSWNKGAARLFGYSSAEALGKHITMLFPADHLDEEPHIIERIRSGERIEHYETVRLRKDGSRVDISLSVSPVKDAVGRIIGASKIARDITERKRAEAERALLMAELSHRVKNTLATVVSIAHQSFAKSPSPAEALRSFDGRIRGLAQTHSRLAEGSWSGVSLETLVLDEIMPYRHEDGSNVRLAGPKVQLNAKCAVSLGMAFHELTTNAAKHGALSSKSGFVDIVWSIEAPSNRLTIQWTESNGPPVAPPQRSGFGRLLLERALAADLKGEVDLEFAERGLRCTIVLPLDELTAPDN